MKTPSVLRAALMVALFLCAMSAKAVDFFTLPDGVRVIYQQDVNSDIVAICVFVKAGVAEEDGRPGVGNLTARALFSGNTNQSRNAIDKAIYYVGGSLETLWTPDYTQITCVTTRTAFEDAFYIIAQALKGAELSNDALVEARKQVESDVERETNEPFRAAYANMRASMYSESAYRTPFSGSSSVLKRLTPEIVKRFYNKRYTPQNTVVSIVGNLDVESVRKTLKNYLLDYERPGARAAYWPTGDTTFESARVVNKLNTKTTLVIAGYPAPACTDPDFPAHCALTAIIGGGKASRLFHNVRDKDGLGYSIAAYTPQLAHPSHLIAYIEYDPTRSNTDGKPIDSATVEKLLTDTVQSVLDTPPTEQELERAKHYTIGSHQLAHQRTRDRAAYLGKYEVLGLGYAFDTELPKKIEAVTLADIKRVAQRYLTRHILSVVEPGNCKCSD